MYLCTLCETSRQVGATASRLDKRRLLADLFRATSPDEIEIAVAFLVGTPRQGRIGIGAAAVRRLWPENAATEATLTLAETDQVLGQLKRTTGPGSEQARHLLLRGLFERATALEQDFLARLLLGELRQGALESLVAEALADAAGAKAGDVRHALMLAGSLGPVATTLLRDGPGGLERYRVEPFRPIQPMLAQSADTIEAVFARLPEVMFEHKLDGARIQAHKRGDEVRVYTRRLRDVTGSVPEVAEAVLALPAHEVIVDGEALALRADGRPHSFQQTMRRFGRTEDVAAGRRKLPLSAFFFDLLYRDGESLLAAPARERVAALDALASPGQQVGRCITNDRDAAAAFLRDTHARGHEGLMAKDPDAAYVAGRRGAAWLKLKPALTLDLVVLAAEWGHGRRRSWLSNLHLGARDPAGGFVMLGKTFKGLTDATLQWQTERLQALATASRGNVVHVQPMLVVEIAFNGIQVSPHYPGGLALRFARVKGYRPDKAPADADTIDTVRELHRRELGPETHG